SPAARESFVRETSDLDHLEIVLARAAFRAGPVHRHVFPARPGGDAFVGQPRGLVVHPSADEAHPRPELDLIFGGHALAETPRKYCKKCGPIRRSRMAGRNITPCLRPHRSCSRSPAAIRRAELDYRPTCSRSRAWDAILF